MIDVKNCQRMFSLAPCNLSQSRDKLRKAMRSYLRYFSAAVLVLVAITASSPQADNTVHWKRSKDQSIRWKIHHPIAKTILTKMSFPSAMADLISTPNSPSGVLRSSRVFPASSMSDKNPSSETSNNQMQKCQASKNTILTFESFIRALNYLEVSAANVGNVHVVSRWTDILVFFIGKNIETHHVNLGMAVLSSFGS